MIMSAVYISARDSSNGGRTERFRCVSSRYEGAGETGVKGHPLGILRINSKNGFKGAFLC